ncbi:MAG: MBG domain-containing protein, partial [Propionibacteriaceae bacterium]|nr:MBG domain-containing protein [Propionibacteriaceae bacterium]
TPGTAGYYYYWVEITNNLLLDDGTSGTPATVTSEFAQARIVNRTLWPQLMNGDFESGNYLPIGESTGSAGSYWDRIPVYVTYPNYNPANEWVPYWDTTHDGTRNDEDTGPTSDTTTGPTAGKAIQLNIHDDSNMNVANDTVFAELANSQSSSLYQDVATVPGKIYEWSLLHSSRHYAPGNSRNNRDDSMAVVIGPAINTQSDYISALSRWQGETTYTSGTGYRSEYRVTYTNQYPYGRNMGSYFQDIVQHLAIDDLGLEAVSDLAGAAYTGRAYTTQWNGSTYYVFISTDSNQDTAFTPRSGAYSVPEGQGTTVFGFVYVYGAGGNSGNVVDDIVFASGTDLNAADTLTFSGETSISVPTQEGFAYALAGVRGSAPFRLTSLEADDGYVHFTPDGAAAADLIHPTTVEGNASDWYVPSEAGTLSFTDLVPGATYRVIGIPLAAISAGLGTNLDPTRVLDDGYYDDITLPASSAGDATTMSNVSAELYDHDSKARVIVSHTDSRVQYAIVDDSGAPALTQVVNGVTTAWFAGDTGTVSFAPLAKNTTYHVVARPAGYTEITPQSALESGSAVTVRTPGVADIQATDVTRTTDGDSDTISVVVDALHNGVEYAVYDVRTGAMSAVQKADVSTGTVTLTFTNLDTGDSYQVVQKEDGASWTTGVRAYPAPARLAVDYVGVALGLATQSGIQPVPASVEYRIAATDATGVATPGAAAANLGWLAGTADTWAAALGSTTIDLGAADSKQGTILGALAGIDGAAGAVVTYRTKAGSDGYTGAAVSALAYLSFAPRADGPAADADYEIEWAAEDVLAHEELEFQTESGGAWSALPASSTVTFADLGWSGVATASASLRSAGVATDDHGTDGLADDTPGSFPSWPALVSIPARRAAPSYVRAQLASGSEGQTITLTSLKPLTAYEYKTPNTDPTDLTGAWTGVTTGASQTTVTGLAKVGEGDYWVRLPATGSAPASHYQAVSIPLMIEPVVVPGYAYGATPPTMTITIANGTSNDVTLKEASLRLDGTGADAFELSSGGSLTVPAVGQNQTWSVTPKAGLGAGTYQAVVVVDYYKDGTSGSTGSTSATVTLTVDKADWDVTHLTASLRDAATTDTSLTVDLAGGPVGATVQVSGFGGGWQAAGSVANDGSLAIVKTGLTPATSYDIKLRLAGDDNHRVSAEIPVGLGSTRYTTPVLADILRIDYQGERLQFQSSVADTSIYRVVAVPAVGEPVELAANASLSALAQAGNFTLQLTRRGDGTHPESAADTKSVVGKAEAPLPDPTPDPANPTTGYLVHRATTDDSANGWIQVNSGGLAVGFEFRGHSTGDVTTGWTSASGETPKTLPIGTYDIRFPATSTAFASRLAVVEVVSNNANLIIDLNGAGTAGSFTPDLGTEWKTVSTGRWRMTYPSDADVTLPTPRWAGHVFAGWNTQADGQGESAASVTAIADPTESVTYYAQWTSYTLTASSVSRLGDNVLVTLTSNRDGVYQLAEVADGAAAPTLDFSSGTTIEAMSPSQRSVPVGSGARDVYAQAQDSAGNVTARLKIDVAAYTPPTVVSVSPGGSNAPLSGSLTVTFSEPVDPASGTVYLDRVELTRTGTSADGTTLTYAYSDLWGGSTTGVTVEGFQDLDGNVMETDMSHALTTPTAVSYTVVQSGGTSTYADSTGLTFTFSQAIQISGLAHEATIPASFLDAISLVGADLEGTVTEGEPANGTVWIVAIENISVVNRANVSVAVADFAGFDVLNNSPQGVEVFRSGRTPVTYSVTQEGGTSTYATTTGLRIEFSQEAPGLPSSAVTLTGATKGALSDCGDLTDTTWCLALTAIDPAVGDGDNVSVTISDWTGFQTPGVPVDAVVYRDLRADFGYTAVQVGGAAGVATTTGLKLTFEAAGAAVLTAEAIAGAVEVNGATVAGVSDGGDTDPLTWVVGLTDITVGDGRNVSLRVADWDGADVLDNEWRQVEVYKDVRVDLGTAGDLAVTVHGTYTYTGSAQVPLAADVVVTAGAATLVEGTDYTYEVTSGGTNAGPATVTVTGKGHYLGSAIGSFTIDPKTPTAADLVYSLDGVTYDGSGHGIAPPTLAAGLTGLGAVTVNYDGATTLPVAAKTYVVTVDIAAGSNFSGVTGLALGSFTVAQRAPVVADLTYSLAPATYNGSAQPVAVGPASGVTGLGDVTVKYNGSATAPTAVGTYAVTVDLAEGANYLAATGLALGNYVITANGAAALTVEGIGNQTYTGSQLTPTVVVKDGPTVLSRGVDYTVAYGANVAVGSGSVTVTGIGNYAGSLASASFQIVARNLAEATVTIGGTYTYNGSAQVPASSDVRVELASETLAASDYTVAVTSGGTGAGPATVSVTGQGNYTGTATGSFTIGPKTPTADDLSYALTGATYDGTGHGIATPTLAAGLAGLGSVTVTYDGSTALPVAAGSYEVAVDIAAGTNFTAADDVALGSFRIGRRVPAVEDLAFSLAPATFTGSAHAVAVGPATGVTGLGAVTVKYSGLTTAPTAVGTYAITVDIAEGDNYVAASSLYLGVFSIVASGGNLTVEPIANQTYTGTQLTPDVVVTSGDDTLVAGTDYSVAYGANLGVGTGYVTVSGKGNYLGSSASASFTIVARPVTGAVVTVNGTYVYTGSAWAPDPDDVSVTLGDQVLAWETDYTFAVTSGGTAVGPAVVTVTGRGNYSGTATGGFTVAAAPVSVLGTEVGGVDTYRDSATIELSFAGAASADGLTAGSLTVEGAVAGALEQKSALVYSLALSGITRDAVTVSVADWSGYHVTGSPVTVPVLRKTRADVDVTVARVGGVASYETTTGLQLTFSAPVTGLSAAAVTVTGATAGALSGSGTTYVLSIDGFADGDQVGVAVADFDGFDVGGNGAAGSGTTYVTVYRDLRPDVTYAVAAEDGLSEYADTTSLKLSFTIAPGSADPSVGSGPGLTAAALGAALTLQGATAGELTAVAGEDGVFRLPISFISAGNQGSVAVTLADIAGYDLDNDAHPAVVSVKTRVSASYVAVQDGGTAGYADSTGIIFTFTPGVTGLTAADFTVNAADAAAGLLSDMGDGLDTTWRLDIGNLLVGDGESVRVAVADPAGFDLDNSVTAVQVFRDTHVDSDYTVSQVDGLSTYRDTTGLLFTFNEKTAIAAHPPVLSAFAVDGATVAGLTQVGQPEDGTWLLTLSAIGVVDSAKVTVTVGAWDGYLPNPAPKPVIVYRKTRADVTYSVDQTGGVATYADSTALTLTFAGVGDASGLAAGKVHVAGATAGALTQLTATTYSLAIRDITVAEGDTVAVTVDDWPGFDVDGNGADAGAARPAAVHRNTRVAVTASVDQVGGVATYATTTGLRLTFSAPVDGLTAGDITVIGSSPGLSVGELVPAGDRTTFTLGVSGFADGETLRVTVADLTGIDIGGNGSGANDSVAVTVYAKTRVDLAYSVTQVGGVSEYATTTAVILSPSSVTLSEAKDLSATEILRSAQDDSRFAQDDRETWAAALHVTGATAGDVTIDDDGRLVVPLVYIAVGNGGIVVVTLDDIDGYDVDNAAHRVTVFQKTRADVTYTVEQVGGLSTYADTTGLLFTFSADVAAERLDEVYAGLAVGGDVTTAEFTDDGDGSLATWLLPVGVAPVADGARVDVTLGDWDGVDVDKAAHGVTLFRLTRADAGSYTVHQDGGLATYRDSDRLLLSFEGAGVPSGDEAQFAAALHLAGATAGELTDLGDGDDTTWAVGLSGLTGVAGVATRVTVQIDDWAGVDLDNSVHEALVYRDSRTDVTVTAAAVGGVATYLDSTGIELTLSPAVSGLTAAAVSVEGAVLGAVTRTGDATWLVAVTGLSGSSVSVTVADWAGVDVLADGVGGPGGVTLVVPVDRDERVDVAYTAEQRGGLSTYVDTTALQVILSRPSVILSEAKDLEAGEDNGGSDGAGAGLGGGEILRCAQDDRESALDDMEALAAAIGLSGGQVGDVTCQEDGSVLIGVHDLTVDDGASVTLTIADWDGVDIDNTPHSVTVYRGTRAPVTYSVAQLGGESGLEDTTRLEVTFAGVDAVAGLPAGLITLTGATLGTVTEVSPLVYRLGLSGLSADNETDVEVTIGDWAGYDVDDGVHRVQVFRRVGQVVADAAGAWLTFGVIANGNADEDHVVGDLSLPLSWLHGATIAWRSDGAAVSDAGAVTRPEYTAADATVTLTATVAAAGTDGTVTRDVTFAVTVPRLAETDAQAVDVAWDELTFGLIANGNAGPGAVTGDLDLVSAVPSADAGAAAVAVTWASSGARVDASTGVVSRPSYAQGAATVVLTATLSKGEVSRTKPFVLTVPALSRTDAEAVAASLAGLDWSVIGGGQAAAAVSGDLVLPVVGVDGTGISWTSSRPDLVGPDGTVTRPAYLAGDTSVTLTATLQRHLDAGAEDSRVFALTVVKAELTDAEAIRAAKAALTWAVIAGANSGPDQVVSGLVLPTSGSELADPDAAGVSIGWSVDRGTWLDASSGAVVSPSFAEGPQAVVLTATLTAGTAEAKTVAFALTLPALPASDAEAVDAGVAGLTWEAIRANNVTPEAVTYDLALATAGAEGTTVAWTSTDEAVIGRDGRVTRPDYTAGDALVTLTATVSKGAAAPRDVTFAVTVVALDPSAAAGVAADQAALTWEAIANGNPSPDAVTGP